MMPAVASSAPQFDAISIVRGDVIRLRWKELHAGEWLVLAFDPMRYASDTAADLKDIAERAEELRDLHAKIVVVLRQSEFEIPAWMNRPPSEGGLDDYLFPVVADSDGEIARLYGMLLDDGRVVHGHFVIDPKGLVRQVEASALPVALDLKQILRCLAPAQ